MNASCDDLILLRVPQKQYGADENKPEYPADPFNILNPTRGHGGPTTTNSSDASTWMSCEGDNEGLRPTASLVLAKSASHSDSSRNWLQKQRGLTLLYNSVNAPGNIPILVIVNHLTACECSQYPNKEMVKILQGS